MALLRLLSVVNAGALDCAFAEGSILSDDLYAHTECRHEKAELPAYWEKFPLATAQDVRAWVSEHGLSSRLPIRAPPPPPPSGSMIADGNGQDWLPRRHEEVQADLSEPAAVPLGMEGVAGNRSPQAPRTYSSRPSAMNLTAQAVIRGESQLNVSQDFQRQYLW